MKWIKSSHFQSTLAFFMLIALTASIFCPISRASEKRKEKKTLVQQMEEIEVKIKEAEEQKAKLEADIPNVLPENQTSEDKITADALKLQDIENQLIVFKEQLALLKLQEENQFFQTELTTQREKISQRKIEAANELSAFIQKVTEDSIQATSVGKRIEMIEQEIQTLDKERTTVNISRKKQTEERDALEKRILDLELVLKKAQDEETVSNPLLVVLRERLMVLDVRITQLKEEQNLLEDQITFLKQLAAIFETYRKESEKRITIETFHEIFFSLSRLPELLFKETKTFGEIIAQRTLEYSASERREKIVLPFSIIMITLAFFSLVRVKLRRLVKLSILPALPGQIENALYKLFLTIDRSLGGVVLLCILFVFLKSFDIPKKYASATLIVTTTLVALHLLFVLGPGLIKYFVRKNLVRYLTVWLYIAGIFLAIVLPAGALFRLYDVSPTLQFFQRYVTYFGLLLFMIVILFHKGQEIRKMFRVQKPSFLDRIYNGMIQFLFWFLFVFLLAVLGLFLANFIETATMMAAAFVKTIALLIVSLSITRVLNNFRPELKSDEGNFSLSLNKDFLRSFSLIYTINGLQAIVAISTLLLALWIWGINSAELLSMLTSQAVKDIFWRLFKTALIITVSLVLVRWMTRFIDLLFLSPDLEWKAFSLRRRTTFGALLQSLLRYTIFTIASILSLNTLGVNATGILAGVSVVGLAIGFGAQTLVRDIITGFFLIIEDSIAVGDVVDTGGIEGTVEAIGLRVTKIREFSGKLHIIPNGEITRLGNFNREWMRAIVPVSVAYEGNVEVAMTTLQEIGKAYCKEHPDVVLGEPETHGLLALGSSEVTVRLVIKVKPLMQWETERNLRRIIKQVFDERGIEIPFPRRVIYHKNLTSDAPSSSSLPNPKASIQIGVSD